MKHLFFILLVITSTISAYCQQRTVDDVKKSISDLSVDLKAYTSAQSKIKSALTNDATKNKAETWWVASRVEFGIYDKNRVNKAIGNKVEVKDMGTALISGYNYSKKALSLDTIKLTNKDGSYKIDKNTGKASFKTKFSKDITNKLLSYMIDFSSIGGDFYKIKDYEKAFNAWEIYHELATSSFAIEKGKIEPDSILGMMRYYQGLASYQLKKYQQSHQMFLEARNYGYKTKSVYDNDINTLILLKDSVEATKVATEAYHKFGLEDVRYMRIMINDCLNRHDMKSAEVMLDQAILVDSLNSKYYSIKGNIVENQMSYKEAFPYYLKALQLDSASEQSNFDVGRCYYMQAIQFMKDNSKKSLKKIMKEVSPIFNKSLLYLEKAFKLNPNNQDTRSILRDIYYKLGDGVKLDQLDTKK